MRLKYITMSILFLFFCASSCPNTVAQTKKNKDVSWKHYGSYAVAANQKQQYELAARYILQALKKVDPKKDGYSSSAILQILGNISADTIAGLVYQCHLEKTSWSRLDGFLVAMMDTVGKKYGPGTLEFALAHNKFSIYDTYSKDPQKKEIAEFWDKRAKQRKSSFSKSEKRVLAKSASYFVKKHSALANHAIEKRYPRK